METQLISSEEFVGIPLNATQSNMGGGDFKNIVFRSLGQISRNWSYQEPELAFALA